MAFKRLLIPASDGYLLSANLFPARGSCRGVVVIHSATAVPQRLYTGFADYLAGEGFETITYDYRGIAASAPSRLRGFQASISDWALKDAEGVQHWAIHRYPDRPLLAVGHSFGGHAIGLCDSSRHLTAAAVIASHAGSLRFSHSRAAWLRMSLIVRGLFPLASAVFGYVPSRRLGLGEDLPKGVARDWTRWAIMPDCFFDDPDLGAASRFARLRIPLISITLDDDDWASPASVDLLLSHFIKARLEHWRIAGEQEGTGKIGHFGYFRRHQQPILWPRLAQWLLRQAESSHLKAC